MCECSHLCVSHAQCVRVGRSDFSCIMFTLACSSLMICFCLTLAQLSFCFSRLVAFEDNFLVGCAHQYPVLFITCCQMTLISCKVHLQLFLFIQFTFTVFCCPNPTFSICFCHRITALFFLKLIQFLCLNIWCAYYVPLWNKYRSVKCSNHWLLFLYSWKFQLFKIRVKNKRAFRNHSLPHLMMILSDNHYYYYYHFCVLWIHICR